MKIRRSHRLVDLTGYLLNHPHTVTPLSYFVEEYNVAKSSLSEDIAIISEVFKETNRGEVQTIAGATGGIRYIPRFRKEEAQKYVDELCKRMMKEERMLPGGYFYLTDLLGEPQQLSTMGSIFASVFADSGATAVMTIATKGVPLAQAISERLNVPFVIVRRDSKVTEGPTVSINYETRANTRVEKMELTRNSLKSGDKVLIIDDFMNGGGTMNGMLSMAKQFDAEVVGVAVLGEADQEKDPVNFPYKSMMKIKKSADGHKLEAIVPGNLLDEMK